MSITRRDHLAYASPLVKNDYSIVAQRLAAMNGEKIKANLDDVDLTLRMIPL
jgi:hypothetical protein